MVTSANEQPASLDDVLIAMLSAKSSDVEASHMEGDRLLCEALEQCAALLPRQAVTITAIVALWHKLRKWYV